MILNNRERVLGWVTLLLLILGGIYVVAAPIHEEWAQIRAQREDLGLKIERSNNLIRQKPMWEASLMEQLQALPMHPPDRSVTADLMKQLGTMADRSNLRLISRKPAPAEQTGDVHQQTVSCDWEGDDKALVAFLLALQQSDAKLDIKQLTVKRRAGSSQKPEFLTGAFKLESAFRKSDSP